ncbi:MAG: S9 family peptidase [Schleiferiaceae bacterium]|nr:S9 family peptidase [Schleiferiaceae bacterium]
MRFSFFAYALLALFLASGFSRAQDKKVTLENVWKEYRFYGRTTRGLRSMKDGEHFTTLSRTADGPAILKRRYQTGETVDTLLTTAEIKKHTGKQLVFDQYQFNPDETMLLLATQTEPIYRHSTKSYYYIYDLEAHSLDSLRVAGKQRLADFSPTENKVAFVYNNRMHVQDLSDGRIIRFGKGKEDAFIAGAVDWVYEEEFSFHKGFHWSPEGSYIAYYQFDERQVPTFSMDLFGKGLYPQQEVFKYPKAGEANSEVQIHLYDLARQKDHPVSIPDTFEYIPRMQWTQDDDELVITTLNRLQNELTLWEAEMESEDELEVEPILHESADTYIEIDDDLTFLADESFIWTSEKDGFNHIYHYDEDGELIRQITAGEWPVTTFYGIDEDNGWLYYQAAEQSPLRRNVYRINLKGRRKQRLSPKSGWNSATFSEGFAYFINRYSSTDTPPLETLRAENGDLVRTINDNASLKERLAQYDLAPKEFFSFTTSYDVKLNGWMIKPEDFDPAKEYPVLMFVYGGPGAQTVKDQYDSFNYFWYQMLAQEGYIVVSVDNRGTGARGRDFRDITYKQLGKYETQDQIAAGKYLARMSYVDAERIGIWGWSYGGYMSSLALTKGAEVFNAAIAVAPVTNWRFYDNIYTERYMGLPQENGAGYDDNSPINHVDKLEDPYLLVHGGGDDNVHLQNTMRMVDALVAANKQFDMFVYPNRTHSIAGGNTRYHLYRMMTDFLLENL